MGSGPECRVSGTAGIADEGDIEIAPPSLNGPLRAKAQCVIALPRHFRSLRTIGGAVTTGATRAAYAWLTSSRIARS
jgi:hypothetical protein